MGSSCNIISSSAFDFLSFQDEEIFLWDDSKRNEFQEANIYRAFEYHYKNCQPYKDYCDFIGVTPQSLKDSKRLNLIPQIPTVLFKNFDISSVDDSLIVKKCTSSGTQGQISKIYRDETTIDRLLCSITVAAKDFLQVENEEAVVANLGPSTEEAGDIWFSYITSITDLLFETEHFVREGILLNDELYSFLKHYTSDKNLILMGPPIMFKKFIEYLVANGLSLKLKNGTKVITAGGWKQYSGEKIDRDVFEQMIMKSLNVQKMEIYDSFNQVELNTVVFECENKKKHIPPWLKVIVRNPTTLDEVSEGELGILSYLDSSAVSYPCFILSDDIGKVYSNCKCGRKGQTLEIVRRVNRVELKGCAIKIESQGRSYK